MWQRSLFCVLLLLLSFGCFSQTLLQKRVNIPTYQGKIGNLLVEIEKQGVFTFAYKSDLVDLDRVIEVESSTYQVEALLKYLFNGFPLKFIATGEHIIIKTRPYSSEPVTIKGYILDSLHSTPLIGANVYDKATGKGATTNAYGYFEFKINPQYARIRTSSVGYKYKEVSLPCFSDTTIYISLTEDVLQIQEVIIEENVAKDPVTDLSISKMRLTSEEISSIPAMFGEVDLLKSLQLLPGIQSAGEGITGLHVRGGSADQTLILLDEATIYNPAHFIGLFSIFSPEAIDNIEVYKAGVPARWGGRLSSIVQNQPRIGNKEKFEANGGIGIISSRLAVEGPLSKNKNASFLFAGRRTYADIVINAFNPKNFNATALYFYDLNGSIFLKPNEKNRFYASLYLGDDISKFYDYVKTDWGNKVFSLRWQRLISDKLMLTSNAHYSSYTYSFDVNIEDEVTINWKSKLEEASIRLDFDRFLNSINTLSFGYNATFKNFAPVTFHLSEYKTNLADIELDKKYGLEQALYLSNQFNPFEQLAIQYGIRYSLYHVLGPGRVFMYENPANMTLNTIVDTVSYEKPSFIKTYHGPEPRIILNYQLTPLSSVKMSYNRMRQYTQVASNATATLPTDRWIPSDVYLKPQVSDQWTVGYFKNLSNKKWSFSLESYYKLMDNQIDFKDEVNLLTNINNQNADIQFNNAIETQILTGKARAYGVEFLLRKNKGRFNGWIAYTWSRTKKQIDGINSNKPYSPRYDRPHDLSLVGKYKFNDKWTLSANWVYSSGYAVTLPEGKYVFEGREIPYYTPGSRNQDRLPDFNRLDLSLSLTPKKSQDKRWKGNWVFSLYNAYSRKNPLLVQFKEVADPDNDDMDKSLRPVKFYFSVFPSVTYNFSWK